MDEWKEVFGFPGYSVSSSGQVRNDQTGRILVPMVSPRGVYVGITRDKIQYSRMVPRLVAECFLEPPPPPYHIEVFDTPINRDGDRENNEVSNLLWRPRWFAIKYHQQFTRGWEKGPAVRELLSGFEFHCILEASMAYGLLALDIFTETRTHTYYQGGDSGVWPTGQHFEVVHNKQRKNRRI